MINHLMALLLDELRAEGIPAPLPERFALAALWDDLARLAGETPPLAGRQLYEDDGPPVDPRGWGDQVPIVAPAGSLPAMPS